MKYIVYALALIVMTGSSCKSKSEDTKPVPEIAKEPPVSQQPAPENHPTKQSDEHHESGDCDHEGKCHHKHKRLPPGHEKKLHGDQSARKYAPGHRNKH
jgi:hypothetical protein